MSQPEEKRRLWRVLLGLVLGITASRLLSIGALLLFSWLSGPDPFAAFGVYLALANILWVLVCGRYDQGIIFAKTESEAIDIAVLSSLIAAIVVGLCIGAVFIIYWCGISFFAGLGTMSAIFVLPASLAGRAASRILINLAGRKHQFHLVSRCFFVQALALAVAQLGLFTLGADPVMALALADAGGLLVASFWLFPRLAIWKTDQAFAKIPGYDRLRAVAVHWAMLPRWNLPASLMSVVAQSLPALALATALPPMLAGQIIFAMRILELPSNLITSTVTPVLQGEIRRGMGWPSLRQAVFMMFLGSAALFGAVSLAAGIGHTFVALSRWESAISALPYVILYFTALSVSGPLVDLVAGFRAERLAIVGHIVFLMAMAVAALALVWGLDWQSALTAFGLAMLVRMIAFIMIVRA